MNRIGKRLLPAAIIVGALAVAALMWLLAPDPATRPPPSRIPVVSTAPAEAMEGAIHVFGAGTVRPRAEIDVAAEVGGKVAWVAPAFQSGGRVRAGQVLFRVADDDYRNRVRQARASVAAQQVAVMEAEEEARLAREEYEAFRRRWEDAGAAQASALALREPQLAAARAALARDSAALADAELALARTEVAAPFGAVVRWESVDLGQFVAPGQGVGRLYADDAVEVVVPLSDRDAALIPGLWGLAAGDDDRGVRAVVEVAYGKLRREWTGYVDRAEAALDEETRTIDVVVRVPDPMGGGGTDPPLLVGQFADVRIDGAAPDRYFAIPRTALRTDDAVWAVRDGNRVAIVPVEVLQHGREAVFVAGALEPGQPVITGGVGIATDGMEVRTSGGGDAPAGTPE